MSPGRNSVRLFLLLSVFLLMQNILLPQDLTEAYSGFIPKSYVYNEFKHQELSGLLRKKSSIHPDLIYYYITYYNKLSEKSGRLRENEADAFLGFLSSKENILLQRRNDWAERQISIIDTMKTDPALKLRAENMFRELLTELINVSSYPQNADTTINESLLNYFSARFYNPEAYPEYHPDLSYFNNKTEEETRLRDRIFTLFEAAERKHPNTNAELISLILGRWYLFDAEDNSKHPEPGEMIFKLLKQNYSVLKQPKFSLGVLYSPFNNACDLKTSILIQGQGGRQDFELKTSLRQLGLSLGYKYYIQDVAGFFSSINFQLLYFTTISSAEEVSAQAGFTNDYTFNAMNYHEALKFGKNILTPKSAKSYYLKITAPVLCFFQNALSLEFGAYASMNRMDYKYSYSYGYIKDESYLAGSMWEQKWYTHRVAAGSGSKEYESSLKDFIISPVLEFTVNSLETVAMGISISLQYSSFSFNYAF